MRVYQDIKCKENNWPEFMDGQACPFLTWASGYIHPHWNEHWFVLLLVVWEHKLLEGTIWHAADRKYIYEAELNTVKSRSSTAPHFWKKETNYFTSVVKDMNVISLRHICVVTFSDGDSECLSLDRDITTYYIM